MIAETYRQNPLISQDFLGRPLSDLIRAIMQESILHPRYYTSTGTALFPYEMGAVVCAAARIYKPVVHETKDTPRVTGVGDDAYWEPINFDPQTGEVVGVNPFDNAYRKDGYAIGIWSRVFLGTKDGINTIGGFGNIPMFDIIKAPTTANVAYVIESLKAKCDLDLVYITRSSKHGMMAISPLIVDTRSNDRMMTSSLLLNHPEAEPPDMWIDDRWIGRSNQNFYNDSGDNLHQGGILRISAAPPLKPEIPIIIDASF